MKTKKTNSDDPVMISLDDLLGIFKRKRRTIYFGTLLCMLLAGLFALTRPINYFAEATFRDKGTKQSDIGSSQLMQALGGMPSTQMGSEAISLMNSRRLIFPVIEKLGLQASVSQKKMRFPMLSKIADNLSIEYGYFKNRRTPLAIRNTPCLLCRDVAYTNEIPSTLELTFLSSESFEVRDSYATLLGEGRLGQSVLLAEGVQFTLYRNPNVKELEVDQGSQFQLHFQPLQNTFKGVSGVSKAEVNKKDKGIVNLSFYYPDREVVSRFINELMAQYHQYLKEESDRLSTQQLSYLSHRENETANSVELLLGNHADSLSSGFSNTGFPDSEKEMEFLGRSQIEYKQRLFNIELELRRLINFQEEDYAYYDQHVPSGDAGTINAILSNIRSLKQQRDVLVLAIKKQPQAISTTENSQEEFQGVSLQAAQEIYRDFSKQISDLQSIIRQHDFLLEQMKQPDFEITSLSAAVKDPISLDMIAKTTALAIAVKDTNNRSEREIARLGDDLALQRQFLILHIHQLNELNHLQEQLLQEKLFAIQGVTIALTNQQISILENHLADYTKIRSENLQQERKLIDEQVMGLRRELSKLPKKWMSEQILKQRLELNKRVMDEVTRLVETKNIAHNMELIQSAPIDAAIAPILPKSPKLLVFAFLGAFLGLCGSCSYLTLQTLSKGITASPSNLQLAGQSVAGYMSRRCQGNNLETFVDGDLSTLRRLAAYLFPSQVSGKRPLGDDLIIIQGKGPDYSESLGKLLSKQQQKVVLLDLSFNRAADLGRSGLLDYLEGRISLPSIQKEDGYDRIATGGISRFTSELVGSARFAELMARLRTEYDQVIAVSPAVATSAEAEVLLKVFSAASVTLSEETLPELNPYLKHTDDKKICFIFV